MIAKFIGTTSMGFIHGRLYSIYTDINPILRSGVFQGYCICLYDMTSTAWCPYGSLEALLQNWEIIKKS